MNGDCKNKNLLSLKLILIGSVPLLIRGIEITNLLSISGEEPSSSEQKSRAASRNSSIDLLRFIGAIGIIQFHCDVTGGWVGLAALPMFVMLLVYFGAGKPIAQQAKRLLLPWLAWSALYACMKYARSVINGEPLSSEFAPWMVLTGASLHLWFLSFSFLFLLFCVLIPKRTPPPLLAFVCVLLSGVSLWISNTNHLLIPLVQWLPVIPAAFAGLLMQRFRNETVVSVALAFSAIAAFYFGIDTMTPQLAIAGLAIALAIAIPMPQTRIVDTLSGLSLGMYLVHPAVMVFTLIFVAKHEALFFPLVVLGSILITALLKRFAPAIV